MDHILAKFSEILCGTLDNQEQIDQEIQQGKQLHPYAKHVTAICNHKIINIPEDYEGIYILEESYYIYPGKNETEIKPLFFYVRSDGKSKAFLQSVQIPSHLQAEEVTNANENLVFDWNALEIRNFGIAEYIYIKEEECFKVDHKADLGDGVTFRLIETLSIKGLEVMELVHKNGVKLTPYDTPIQYKRIKL